MSLLLAADPWVDVHGEDGGGGVEDGGEGGHQGRKHHCHHGTAHTNLCHENHHHHHHQQHDHHHEHLQDFHDYNDNDQYRHQFSDKFDESNVSAASSTLTDSLSS